MLDFLMLATIGVIVFAMIVAYERTRDPLHPMMYLGPMMLYIYALIPSILFYRGMLPQYFRSDEGPIFAQTVTLLSILALCIGCLRASLSANRTGAGNLVPRLLSDQHRKLMLQASHILAGIGLSVFLYGLIRSGGLLHVYSRAKGGVSFVSGYVSSAPLLTIPAIMLYLFSKRRDRLDIRTVFVMLLYISPHLTHGLLSGSRGTTFLALGTLLFGWHLSTQKRPHLHVILTAIVAIGVLMIFLKSQRRHLYLGAEAEINQEAFVQELVPVSEIDVSHTSIYSWGSILTSHKTGKHYWGRRYVVQLLVRPIPKQIWPTKYADTGTDYMVTSPGSGGFTVNQWLSAVGWVPQAGSACGFVSDTFVEFAWGGLVLCYLVGALYGYLWRKAAETADVIWALLYLDAAVVSIYLPTQGLTSAWGYRFIFLAVPTVVLWKLVSRKLRTIALPRGHPDPRLLVSRAENDELPP